MVFKFKIPYLLSVESSPIPLGFVLLITFCLGMIAIAILEALPSVFKTMQVRSMKKRIKELERELTVVREMATSKDPEDEPKASDIETQ